MRLLANAAYADGGAASTDGCGEAAGASTRAPRLVHRQPHSTTWRFRRSHLIAVAVVASVLRRDSTTSILAAHAVWVTSSISRR